MSFPHTRGTQQDHVFGGAVRRRVGDLQQAARQVVALVRNAPADTVGGDAQRQ